MSTVIKGEKFLIQAACFLYALILISWELSVGKTRRIPEGQPMIYNAFSFN